MKYNALILMKNTPNSVSVYLTTDAFLFSNFESKDIAKRFIDTLITNKYVDFKPYWSWSGKEYIEHNKFVKNKKFISKLWANKTNTSLITVCIFSNKVLNEYKKLDNYFNCLVSDFRA